MRAAQVPGWSAQPVTRIGSVDDAAQALTRVSGILIDSRASVYVLQPQDREVVVFDSAGRRLRVIGRRGEGPGEFDSVTGAGLRGDTLYVADNSLGRISFFDPSGAPVSTLRLASRGFGTPPAYYLPTVPTMLLDDGSGLVRPDVPIALLASGTGRVPWLRIGRDGAVIDTLIQEDLPPRTFEIIDGGNRIFAPMQFMDAPLFHVLADGSGLVVVDRPVAAQARNAEFRVTKIGLDGDTAFSRVFAYSPAPVDAEALDAALAWIEARFAGRRNAPGRAAIERALRSADLVPAWRPPVISVASGVDGSIWLNRDVAAQGASWLIVGPTGDPIGELSLPAGQTVMAVRDGVLAAVELDSLDVPYVVLYRLRR